jgi:limonene-1,2-epoxide hydrolase/heme-degrading monooxygenase HmoA
LIARIWRGAVRKQDGDAYARYMQSTGVAGYTTTKGNRGVWMLRRDIEENTEFLMFTLWDSLDSVRAFAGQDYETAVFYSEDDRFLVDRDHLSSHYVVDTQISPPGGDTLAARTVREHVAALNEQNLDRLLACFSADATWVADTDRLSGSEELARFFQDLFSSSPEVSIETMVSDGDRVACEMSEQLVVDGVTRVNRVAGFYEVQDNRITAATIYRRAAA